MVLCPEMEIARIEGFDQFNSLQSPEVPWTINARGQASSVVQRLGQHSKGRLGRPPKHDRCSAT
jgi:hypothetical protein